MAAATVAVPSAVVLEVLTTRNYDDWSFQIETYLLAKGLWKVVEDGEAEYDEVWRKNNAEALHAIHVSCGKDTFSFIRGIKTARDAWNTLEKKLKPKREDARSEIQSTVDGELQLKDLKPVVEGHSNNSNSTTNDPDDRGCNDFFNWVRHWLSEVERAKAVKFLEQYPQGPHPITELRDPSSGLPALHFAVDRCNLVIVEKLVGLLTEKELEETLDREGSTALGYVLKNPNSEMEEMVKCMVVKNMKLLDIIDPSTNMIPLVQAHRSYNKIWCTDMVEYLYKVTPRETLNVHQAAEIISQGFRLGEFDISWDLIQRYPSLAITTDLSGKYPLNRLAESPKWKHYFLSESGLNFWEQWIYDRIVIPPAPTISDTSTINVPEQEAEKYDQRPLTTTGFFKRLFKGPLRMLGLNRIHYMKLRHTRIHKFLSYMCLAIQDKDVTQMQNDSLLRSAIFRAVEQGKVEFITHMWKSNNHIFKITNEQDMTLFQFAADCRQEEIYSLVYLYIFHRKKIYERRDKLENNMLHIVGTFSSFAQTRVDNIRGAALQLQRERQWFKEVESNSPLESLEVENHTDQAPPRVVFSKYHKELMKEGEKSMKETATSCTVVGALVVTMMFAAAFTVPGGNNGDTGAPTFIKEKAFMVFIISDAISLFSSTTSVVIFLGVLTSRYKEDDFLKSLPTKMISGLFTLFLSITTMMITFSAALYMMLHGNSWIIIPIILLSSIPIASFVWMQFPFFVEIFVSTYGAGIFVKDDKMYNRCLKIEKKMYNRWLGGCERFYWR